MRVVDAGIPADVEVAGVSRNYTLQASADAAHKSLLFPVPNQHLPVGLATERGDERIVFQAECCCDEFLTLVLVALGLVVRHGDSLFVARYFADCKDRLLACWTAFADAEKVLFSRHANVGYRLCSFGACFRRYAKRSAYLA